MTAAPQPTLDELLRRSLDTESEADAWIHQMHEIGYGAHPDDSGATLIDFVSGERTFTDEQAELYDQRMGEACALLDDIYETSLTALHAAQEGER